MKLSSEICLSMKGIAILCIMMHNFLHCVYVEENEFTFSLDNYNLVNSISVFDWNTIFHYISYWGWYGVPIFIFLSGYGLSQKYEFNNHFLISKRKFIMIHFIKLWCLLMPAFIVYLFITWCEIGDVYIRPALAQASMIINLIYSPNVIQPGVYWFFGLILQLYIVYAFFCYKKKDIYPIVLSLISLLFICFIIYHNSSDGYWLGYIRHNCLGWLMIFCVGILFSRRDLSSLYIGFRGRYILFVILLATFFIWLFNFNAYTWLLTPILSITIIASISKLLSFNQIIYICSIKLGEISSCIFVIHSLVREIFLLNNYRIYIPVYDVLFYIFISIILSFFYKSIYEFLLTKVNRALYKLSML